MKTLEVDPGGLSPCGGYAPQERRLGSQHVSYFTCTMKPYVLCLCVKVQMFGVICWLTQRSESPHAVTQPMANLSN